SPRIKREMKIYFISFMLINLIFIWQYVYHYKVLKKIAYLQAYFKQNMPGRAILSFLLLSTLFNSVYSQYDNSFFDHDRYDKALDSSHFQWHFDNLNYFYNTEYTSLVDKGSTYPGFQLLPYIQYSFRDKAEIFGGLFVRYD